MKRTSTALVFALSVLSLAGAPALPSPPDAHAAQPTAAPLAADTASAELPAIVISDLDGVRTGTVTNGTGATLSVAAYQPHDPDLLQTTASWQVWNEAAGAWTSPFVGWCGTGLTSYAIDAGETVAVALSVPSEPGTYRYQLPFASADGAVSGVFYSAPFEVPAAPAEPHHELN
jgi:hypothetical protein